jgi:hypothetical protein
LRNRAKFRADVIDGSRDGAPRAGAASWRSPIAPLRPEFRGTQGPIGGQRARVHDGGKSRGDLVRPTDLDARHGVALLVLGGVLANSSAAIAGAGLPAGPDSRAARASVQFMVRVPAVTLLRVDGAPAQIAVSSQDVARGYAEVAGVSLGVVANGRGSKFLSAAANTAVASSVEVIGLPGSLVASPEGQVQIAANPRHVVNRRYDVRVRVNLAPGVGEGRHPWPLVLRIAAP